MGVRSYAGDGGAARCVRPRRDAIPGRAKPESTRRGAPTLRCMSVDLTGAADLHCHFGPDPHRERSVDAFEAAAEAAAAGHRAVVLKSHDAPTASLAWAVQRATSPDISVFGGICCDREVGGVNPAAVEVALGLG